MFKALKGVAYAVARVDGLLKLLDTTISRYFSSSSPRDSVSIPYMQDTRRTLYQQVAYTRVALSVNPAVHLG